MRRSVALVVLLVARSLAYTWTPIGPGGTNVHDWRALVSDSYASILCADSCIVLEGAEGWEIHTHEGLACYGALSHDSTTVLLAMGNGSAPDGIYRFGLTDHVFALRYACPAPRFIEYSLPWNAYFAGHGAGLAVSTNARDWLAVDDFGGTACNAMAVADSCLVLAADTAAYFADQNSFKQFTDRIHLGLVAHAPITEASGIVASRRNAGVLWTHNDSGNPNTIYALRDDGTHLGAYTIAGATNRDWEDIAIGYDAVSDRYLIYVGDIGDNNGAYDDKYIYVVEEPSVLSSQPPVTETLYGMERITFQYPSGARYNAETLLIDPFSKDLYVVTKQGGGIAQVFRAAYPQSTTETIVMGFVTDLSGLGGYAVGGDISPSGHEILIKTYAQMFHWSREHATPLGETFDAEPTALPYVQEPQGEAVCWMPNLMGYYTISEEPGGVPAHLYLYRREAWQQAQPSPFTVTDIARGSDDVMHAVWPGQDDGAGLWGSEDHGATWTLQLSAPGMGAVVVDGHDVIFAGWQGTRDTTGVAVWVPELNVLSPVNGGLPCLSINRLRIDSRIEPGVVVCCTDSGATALTGYFDPMNLSIRLAAPGTARLQWPPVPAATHYDIYGSPLSFRWMDSLPLHTVSVPGTTLIVTDGVCIPDTAFFFSGRARNPAYVTPWSNIVGVLNRGLP